MRKKKKLGTRMFISIMAVLVYGILSAGITGMVCLVNQSQTDMQSAMTERVASASNLVSVTLRHYSSLVSSLDGTTAQTDKIKAADSSIVDINTRAETSPGIALSTDGYIVITGEYAKGTAYIAIGTDWIDQILSDTGASDSAEYYIVTSDGRMVASVNGTLSQDQIAPYAGANEVRSAKLNGSDRIVYDDAIDGTDFTVITSCDAAEFSSNSAVAMRILLIAFVISFGGGAFVIRRIVKSIIGPVEAINKKILSMAEGDLSGESIIVNTGNELQTLAEAVNAMADHSRNIISDISHVAARIADEDLTVETHTEYVGDYAPIKTALDGIVDSTSGVIRQIEASSRMVAEGSGVMSVNSTTLSESAAEQAATMEELNASVVEISSNITANADSAEKAKALSDDCRAIVDEGSAKMSDMLRAMEQINETSSKIANIIKAIEDISFQTNILSLNASIEAARAGEAGKGFAVVAGEVGELASKTAEAAKNTTALIKTALSAVENGTVMANETALMLDKIVAETDDTARVIDQIADASRVQADSVKQILVGMDQISTSVQMTSGSSSECAASAEELSGQAKVLLELVQRFKLPDAEAVKKKQAEKRAAERQAKNNTPSPDNTSKPSAPVNSDKKAAPVTPEPAVKKESAADVKKAPNLQPKTSSVPKEKPVDKKPEQKPAEKKPLNKKPEEKKPKPKPVEKKPEVKQVEKKPEPAPAPVARPRSRTIVLDDDKY